MVNFKNIALLALLLMNVALILMLWLRPLPASQKAEREGRRPRAEGFLGRALDLDEDQHKALRKLRDEHFQLTRGMHEEGRLIKGAMFDALLSDTPDTATALAKAKQYADQMSSIDEALILHYLDIRDLCDSAQQDRLRNVFRQAIRRPPPR